MQLVSDGHTDAEDRYGRLLRYVETEDGTDAGATLITEGYAYAWAPATHPVTSAGADCVPLPRA